MLAGSFRYERTISRLLDTEDELPLPTWGPKTKHDGEAETGAPRVFPEVTQASPQPHSLLLSPLRGVAPWFS